MVCLLLWASWLLIVLLFTVFRYVWFYCLCFVDILLLLTADVCVYVGCLVWWVLVVSLFCFWVWVFVLQVISWFMIGLVCLLLDIVAYVCCGG